MPVREQHCDLRFRYDGTEYTAQHGDSILQALERAGVYFDRRIGCRQGFCGACVVTSADPDSHDELRGLLACITPVRNAMTLESPRLEHPTTDSLIPAGQDLTFDYLRRRFPELPDCVDGGACTTVCPIGVPVHAVIMGWRRNEFAFGVESTHACVSCGLCYEVCPGKIAPYVIAEQIRAHAALTRPASPRLEALCRGSRSSNEDGPEAIDD